MPLLPITDSPSVVTCPKFRRYVAGGVACPPGWAVRRYPLTQPLPAEWTKLQADDFFLSEEYLQLLGGTATNIEGGLALAYERLTPVVGVHFQLLSFHAGRQIRSANGPSALRDWVADRLSFRVLCLGHLQLSGAHALAERGTLPAVERAARCEAIAYEIARQLRAEGQRIDGIMLKDLAPLDSPESNYWKTRGFHQLPVQPSMVMPLDPVWKNKEDYLAALSAKYRTRYRRARKKADGLQRRCLSSAAVEHYQQDIYRLYRNLAGEAPFNAVELTADYFAQLKALDQDRVSLFGYFDAAGQLVGFCSAIRNRTTLDAHFVGYDEATNTDTQLYLNMLYDLVEKGIDWRVKQVDFARTALEIKSSVGARPQYDFCGLRGHNPLLNAVLPYVAHWLSPLPAWTPRHPFREA